MTTKELIKAFLTLVDSNEVTLQQLIFENAIDLKVMEKHMVIRDFERLYKKVGAIRAYDELAEKYNCCEHKIRIIVSKKVSYC